MDAFERKMERMTLEEQEKVIRAFIAGVFEFDEKWFKERNLHHVLVGEHLTRENCVDYIKDTKLGKPKLTEAHLESCSLLRFKNEMDSCLMKMSLLMDVDDKGINI